MASTFKSFVQEESEKCLIDSIYQCIAFDRGGYGGGTHKIPSS